LKWHHPYIKHKHIDFIYLKYKSFIVLYGKIKRRKPWNDTKTHKICIISEGRNENEKKINSVHRLQDVIDKIMEFIDSVKI
jgi:hypothetical protein